MAYLVDDLLADAKVRANYPATNGTITDSELLQLGNDELQGILTGRLTAAMQGYYATETSITVVSGQSAYDIPTRAIGARIDYAVLVDGSGNRFSMNHLSAGGASMLNRTSSANVSGYFIQGNQLVIVPALTSSPYTMAVGYFRRPGRMVLSASCAKATAASAIGATTLTVANTATVIPAGINVDIVSSIPHFNGTNFDLLTTAPCNTTTITLTSGLTQALTTNDYVCPQNTSCVVQLPVEVQPLLSARWALRILRQRGDLQQAEALKSDVADLEASIYTYLTNRVESQVETIQNNNIASGVGLWNYSGLSW